MDDISVTIRSGPRKGEVLTGRRALRYLNDPEYRRYYDTTPAPGKAQKTEKVRVEKIPPHDPPTLPGPGRVPVAPPPSFLQKLANLGRDGMKHLIDQGRKVPQEVYEIRLEVCQGCPLYKDNRCTHPRCGCQMASSSKMTGALWWASKECPDSPPRWLRWSTDDQARYEELKKEQAASEAASKMGPATDKKVEKATSQETAQAPSEGQSS